MPRTFFELPSGIAAIVIWVRIYTGEEAEEYLRLQRKYGMSDEDFELYNKLGEGLISPTMTISSVQFFVSPSRYGKKIKSVAAITGEDLFSLNTQISEKKVAVSNETDIIGEVLMPSDF